MSRRNYKFKQSDIVRALKAARTAGLDPRGFEIDPNGTLRVLGNGGDTQIKQTNSDDLDRELAAFEARHGQG